MLTAHKEAAIAEAALNAMLDEFDEPETKDLPHSKLVNFLLSRICRTKTNRLSLIKARYMNKNLYQARYMNKNLSQARYINKRLCQASLVQLHLFEVIRIYRLIIAKE